MSLNTDEQIRTYLGAGGHPKKYIWPFLLPSCSKNTQINHLGDQLGITHLAVELDAKVIVQLVLSNNDSNRAYSPILNDCRFLLNRFQHFKVSHIFREANRAVDRLAKEGCSSTFDFVILDYPDSDELCNILDSNAKGLYTLRRSANTSADLNW